jgi:hypothetical protein
MRRCWLVWIAALPVALPITSQGLPPLQNIPANQPFTFAVLGDNRGDDTGRQPPAFLEVLQAVDHEAPAFVLDSGDMIYGYTTNEAQVRDEWRIYRETIAQLHAPMFHVPGNHDIWDKTSARLYNELWGPAYYSFDYGNARFIGLDTETGDGRLGDEQLRWLTEQLETASQRIVFLFLHRPPFPVDGAIGSSLDTSPSERDGIHALFVQHRQAIRGVFAGHEHLYSFQERDGVPYYISGGGGAPLYMAPELGGFHHFLMIHVSGNRVQVELHKVGAAQSSRKAPKRVAAGELLETWDRGWLWYAWDRTATIELTADQASNGRRGLRFNFDLAQYAWPILALAPASPWDLRQSESVSLDVFVPKSMRGALSLTPTLEGTEKHEAPPVDLEPGWNTVTAQLDAPWLPSAERGNIRSLEWRLSAHQKEFRGYVVFDNLRARRRNANSTVRTEMLESWERPLLWRVFDETVSAEMGTAGDPGERQGLLLHLDFSECGRPVVFTQLNPPWNLTKVRALLLSVRAATPLPEDLAIELSFKGEEVEFRAPALPLRAGITQMRFDLEGDWLPQKVRVAAQQVAFMIVTTNRSLQSNITLQRLSAAADH